MYAIFLNIFKNEDGNWIKEYNFYESYGVKNIEIETDWRTRAIPNKRQQLILLGHANLDFPIIFPIKLTTGQLINSL